MKNWREGGNDFIKLRVFRKHPSYYAPIKAELKAWVADNLREVWMAGGCPWFDDAVLCSIPVEMLPKEEAEELTKLGEEGGRRIMSAVEVLLGVDTAGVKCGETVL